MLTPSDPLFWLIAFGLTFPWGVVVWTLFDLAKAELRVDELKVDVEDVLKKWNDAELALLARGPAPMLDAEGAKILQFEPRLIEGGMSGGKYQRPLTAAAVVDIPFKGPIS